MFSRAAWLSLLLEIEIDDNNDGYCWPINEKQTLQNTICIKYGERCDCRVSVNMMVQCMHDLSIDDYYDRHKYHHRWYSKEK